MEYVERVDVVYGYENLHKHLQDVLQMEDIFAAVIEEESGEDGCGTTVEIMSQELIILSVLMESCTHFLIQKHTISLLDEIKESTAYGN